MGYCDDPKLKLFHTIEPSNVYQGMVGDCWLLSAVACLAEYKNAVQKVFRKTKNLQDRPLPSPNQYVVTLWDVNKTWKEVDYVVDERLLVNEQGQLLASKPAFASGDIWVPYLEKAVAVAMGGWDKLYSGQPTRAWAMLTGRKEQYVVQRAPSSANTWQCVNKLNPMTQQMEDFSSAVWYPTTWPGEEGANSSGGGAANMGQPMNLQEMMMGGGFNMANLGATLTGGMTKSEDELFVKLSEWRNKNYMVAAITKGTNDQIVNDGIAEAHSFSVLEAYCDLAGTGIHLLKLRNPWGKANGELVNGEFDKHKGPGWKNYPQIKSKVKPIKTEDNGVFWITKREFLQYFKEIFVCAVDTKKEASSK